MDGGNKDFMNALEAFEEEIEGIEEYTRVVKDIEDNNLKRIFTDLINVEKQHANTLLNWINNKAKEKLR